MKKYIYITALLACNFYMSQSAADTYQKIVPQAPDVSSLLKNFENPVSLIQGLLIFQFLFIP